MNFQIDCFVPTLSETEGKATIDALSHSIAIRRVCLMVAPGTTGHYAHHSIFETPHITSTATVKAIAAQAQAPLRCYT